MIEHDSDKKPDESKDSQDRLESSDQGRDEVKTTVEGDGNLTIAAGNQGSAPSNALTPSGGVAKDDHVSSEETEGLPESEGPSNSESLGAIASESQEQESEETNVEQSSAESNLESNADNNGTTNEVDASQESKEEIAFRRLEEAKEAFRQKGQAEMPFALVQGQAMTQLPLDLYIPPDALEVILEQFEGPLDLLLYLIRKQNLDILEINVAEITAQYMKYVEMMMAVQLELAGDYLVMAAMLAEIKSRMLLPREQESEDEDDVGDPRAELIRRLQEYERFKQAAEELDELPRLGRDNFEVSARPPEYKEEIVHPDVDMKEIMIAFAEVLKRAERFEEHEVAREALSTRERMSDIIHRLRGGQFVPFVSLFTVEEGKSGVVTTFLAVLELIKEKLIDIIQTEEFGPIHVKAKSDEPAIQPEQ